LAISTCGGRPPRGRPEPPKDGAVVDLAPFTGEGRDRIVAP